MRRLVPFGFGLAIGFSAIAAPSSIAVRAEIEALLGRLESSHCEFNRNGGWYTGADAKAHLLNKLGYLERNTSLRSTEQFIEQAASVSSSSGRPYQVKCGNNPSVPSSQWLAGELARLRASGPQPASAPR